MALDKDIKRSINRAAHQLTQQQYFRLRVAIAARVKAMQAEKKPRSEVASYLEKIAANGSVN
ncbi:MAG: hypothetical protein ABIR84_04790 [Candidatus Nitrotoga sp.]